MMRGGLVACVCVRWRAMLQMTCAILDLRARNFEFWILVDICRRSTQSPHTHCLDRTTGCRLEADRLNLERVARVCIRMATFCT